MSRFCESGLKDSSFLDSGFWNFDFCEMVWRALKRFLGINFCMACLFLDVLCGKGALIGIRMHLDFCWTSSSGGDNWGLCVRLCVLCACVNCVLVCGVFV